MFTHTKIKSQIFWIFFFLLFSSLLLCQNPLKLEYRLLLKFNCYHWFWTFFFLFFFSSFNLNTNKVTKISTEFFFILERFYLVFHIVKLKKKLLILQHRKDSAPVRVRVLGIIARVEKNSSYMAAVEFFTQ